MPSILHDGIVHLLRDEPELAATLVRDLLGVRLPAYTEARFESADLTDVVPATRHADAVIVLSAEGRPVHADVVEVQLAADPDKRLSWPAYAVNLRSRLGCDVEVLVIAPDRAVARWASRPIRLGPSNVFRALVVGPDRLPCITDAEQARAHVELAVLSAVAHGRDASEVAVPAAVATLSAIAGLEDPRALLYSDLVWLALGDAARAALEALMRSGGYEYQSEFARRYFDEGKAEGRAEGEAAGRAKLLVKLLQLKFGALPPELHDRIASARVEELERWGERVLSAATLEDVLR